MPKRQSVKTHKSDEVQGVGSFVVTTEVKVKEIRVLRKRAADPDLDAFEEGIKLLAKHVVKWNWVDDEGKPLPSPKDNLEVMDDLTDGESQYLTNLLIGEKGAAKN